MNVYTVSRLAPDAGVSVHVMRDYMPRGLLRSVQRTAAGYGLFDAQALQRLYFVRAALDAGIGLDMLTRLCQAQNATNGDEALAHLAGQR